MIAKGTASLSHWDICKTFLQGEKMLSHIILHHSACSLSLSYFTRTGQFVNFQLSQWPNGNPVILRLLRKCPQYHWLWRDLRWVLDTLISKQLNSLESSSSSINKGLQLNTCTKKIWNGMCVFCVPLLTTPEWWCQIFKSADLVINLPLAQPYCLGF